MEKLVLKVSKRDVTGKKVRFLRREGKTPAIIYGPKMDSMPITADTKELGTTLHTAGGTDLISLTVDGGKTPVRVLVREVQREPITEELLHVDFYKVDLTQKITAAVPLVMVGEAPVLKKKNTSILHLLDSIDVEALPDHLPHNIEVDLSGLEEVDQAILVGDIKVSPDVTIVTDPEQAILRAMEARVSAEAEEAPAAEGEEGAEAAAEGEEGAEAAAPAEGGTEEAKE